MHIFHKSKLFKTKQCVDLDSVWLPMER